MGKKILKFGLLIAALIILAVGLLTMWLGSGNLTPAKIRAFQIIPYPMALVNGHPILMRDFVLRLNVSEKISPSPSPSGPGNKPEIYSAMILEEQIRQISASKDVSLGRKQLDQEFEKRASDPEFKAVLNAFGLSESDYKSKILYNELLLNNLKVWYNGQKDLNTAAYESADGLVAKIALGESFENLAKSFSQDQNSKDLGGDLGFVDSAKLIAELREPVELLKDKEVKILPSRFGLHIIKQESQRGTEKHLRQIFLSTSGFDEWLNAQTQNFKVKKLVDINK